MAVKLDVSINWITNLNNLEKSMLSMNSRISKMSKSFTKGYSLLGAPERTQADIASLEKYQKIFNKLYIDYDKMNKQGKLAGLWRAMTGYKPTGNKRKGILSAEELSQYTSTKAWQEVDRYMEKQKAMKYATTATAESYKAHKRRMKEAGINEYQMTKSAEMTISQIDRIIARLSKRTTSDEKRAQIQKRRNEEQRARIQNGEEKWNIKMHRLHAKALEENKKRDDLLRRKRLMMMLGKWGKLGIGGVIAGQILKYVGKAVGYAYATSMTSLDWERTIRGGASGGSWFGKDIASYQRAGIDANQLQSFKRGIQGYLGSVKLGMGNAAPLMMLGVSALGSPDEVEKQIENALRRYPKEVSLALAQQMGLDYNMWDAIYSGRLDREKSAYSEESIQKWSNLADSLNNLITNLNTFFYNFLAPVANFAGKYIDKFVNTGSGFNTFLNTAGTVAGFLNPSVGLGQLIRFGAVEVILKNEKGEVLAKTEAQPDYSGDMIELGKGAK